MNLLRILNTIPGAILGIIIASTFIQKAEAGWWNWIQPSSEDQCQAYVKQKLSNHPNKNVQKYAWFFTPKVTELIKDRNANRMSLEASKIFIQNNLQSYGVIKASTSKWISNIVSSEVESARTQKDCSQIK